MGISVKANHLAGPGVTGNSATVDPGFQPKALIAWNGLQAAPGAAANAQFYIGMSSSSTTERGAGYNSTDNNITSDTVRTFSGTRPNLAFTSGTTTANIGNTLTSFDATGFTLNWDILTTTSPLFNYLAIGGADITNVTSGSFAANTSTGNQSVTGLGYQPDIVFLFITNQTGNGQTNGNVSYGLGVATSPSARWTTGITTQHSQSTMNTQRYFYDNHCLVIADPTSAAIDGSADFVSMNSGGFTINWDDAPAAAYLVGYMAIKGGRWKVGTDTQKTSTGTRSTTGVGFVPKGVIFASHCDTTTNSIAAHSRLMFGATTGVSNNVALWAGDQDAAVGLSVSDTIMSSSKALVMATEGTPTTNAEASLSTFDADGFTLNWSTADATARVFGYVAFGETTGHFFALL